MPSEQPEEMPSVVEQLREAIRKDGRSLNQLSKDSGVDVSSLSRFIRGERDLKFEIVERVCRQLRLVLAPYSPDERPGAPPGPTEEPKKRQRKGKP